LRGTKKGHRVSLLSLGISLAFGTPLHASADAAQIPEMSSMTTLPGDNIHVGKGKHNFNRIDNRSITVIKGTQAFTNGNAGAKSSIRNAFCKKTRHCKIIEK
jgi:hypothetical protein